MIRLFEFKDLEKFTPNENSSSDDILFVFKDKDYKKYTMDDQGVKAIICFRQTAIGEWAGFFLVSNSFTARDGIVLKNFIQAQAKEHAARRLWTASAKVDRIIAWHKFLGMSREGEVAMNGKNYDIWSMTWD